MKLSSFTLSRSYNTPFLIYVSMADTQIVPLLVFCYRKNEGKRIFLSRLLSMKLTAISSEAFLFHIKRYDASRVYEYPPIWRLGSPKRMNSWTLLQ